MNSDEFDNLPDEFSGIDFDCIKDLAPLPPPASPSNYSDDGEKYDDAFFRELDRLEQSAQPLDKVGHPERLSERVLNDSSKERKSSKHHLSSPECKSKSKIRRKDFRQALQGIEDEITCAICCDLFVAAHLTNPCGHTLCGECGWQWITKNRISPTCAICRTALNKASPIIPNIAVDNTVEKHIEVLASNGGQEWTPSSKNSAERNVRKERWKEIAIERAATRPHKKPKRRGRDITNMSDEQFLYWLRVDEELDETYQDTDDDHARRTRPRR